MQTYYFMHTDLSTGVEWIDAYDAMNPIDAILKAIENHDETVGTACLFTLNY